jgi:hypothetical protein
MKTLTDPATIAHDTLDGPIESIFKTLSIRGKKADALAILLYGAYASVFHGYRGFEKRHNALDPCEADIARKMADMLLIKNGKERWTDEEIRRTFATADHVF